MRRRTIKAYEIVIPIKVRKLKGGDYLATSSDLPGLIAEGRTMTEAMEIAQDVAKKLIESYMEHEDSLPSALRRQFKRKTKDSYLQIPVAVNF